MLFVSRDLPGPLRAGVKTRSAEGNWKTLWPGTSLTFATASSPNRVPQLDSTWLFSSPWSTNSFTSKGLNTMGDPMEFSGEFVLCDNVERDREVEIAGGELVGSCSCGIGCLDEDGWALGGCRACNDSPTGMGLSSGGRGEAVATNPVDDSDMDREESGDDGDANDDASDRAGDVEVVERGAMYARGGCMEGWSHEATHTLVSPLVG